MQGDYGYILAFLIGGIVYVGSALLVSSLVRPHKPTPEKMQPYECAEHPIGSAFVQYNVRYYLFAVLFVLFDVEVVFLMPWAVGFVKMLRDSSLGALVFVEMFVFLFVLIVALVYAWKKGALEWV